MRAEDIAAETNATFADGRISFDSAARELLRHDTFTAPVVRTVPRLILGKGALRARVIAAAKANRPTVTVGGQTVHIRVCDSSVAYWTDPAADDELICIVGSIA